MATSAQKHQNGPHLLQYRFFGSSGEDPVLKKPNGWKRGWSKVPQGSKWVSKKIIDSCISVWTSGFKNQKNVAYSTTLSYLVNPWELRFSAENERERRPSLLMEITFCYLTWQFRMEVQVIYRQWSDNISLKSGLGFKVEWQVLKRNLGVSPCSTVRLSAAGSLSSVRCQPFFFFTFFGSLVHLKVSSVLLLRIK